MQISWCQRVSPGTLSQQATTPGQTKKGDTFLLHDSQLHAGEEHPCHRCRSEKVVRVFLLEVVEAWHHGSSSEMCTSAQLCLFVCLKYAYRGDEMQACAAAAKTLAEKTFFGIVVSYTSQSDMHANLHISAFVSRSIAVIAINRLCRNPILSRRITPH